MENISQLVSYCGYDVVEDQSGNRVGKTKISKKVNPRIRRVLYFPSISAVSSGVPSLYDLFHRTLAKHHIKMKSYVAVQKKLLILIYTLWKKNEAFKDMTQGNVNPDQCGGRPCIRGLRIRVVDVLDLLAVGQIARGEVVGHGDTKQQIWKNLAKWK